MLGRKQIIPEIIPMLKAALPSSVGLCKMVEDSILTPLRQNRKIPPLLSSRTALRPNLSLMEAVTPIKPTEVPDPATIKSELTPLRAS
jgi:hypothetical protein